MKGLCQQGLMDEAYKLFKDMEKVGCLPNNCCYNIIIQGFLKHEDLPKASELINEMVDKGFSADDATTELVVHLSQNNNLILRLLKVRNEGSAN
uniref:Pentacotripeptide-repeat region of PRORP domain-containing protein n=3 Tax=Manihot esculenta TaxID=3983 RepID=A0A2C9W641_MANES